jgi:hypothetical protein
MLLYMAELLKVEVGEKYTNLTFVGEKYDVGFGRMTECSVRIGIPDECKQYISNYRNHIGEKVVVGIRQGIKNNNLWQMVTTDVLEVTEMLTA